MDHYEIVHANFNGAFIFDRKARQRSKLRLFLFFLRFTPISFFGQPKPFFSF